ncbi:type II secretion system protein [bacterium]|nr:type II secretion system protein [bacterium]
MNFNSYIISETKTAFSVPLTKNLITKKTFKQKAFTLAETLITLSIIGVVAAMTVPTLMTKYKEQESITRLKKAHSVLANALAMQRTVQEPLVEDYEYQCSGNQMCKTSRFTTEHPSEVANVLKDFMKGRVENGYLLTDDGISYGFHATYQFAVITEKINTKINVYAPQKHPTYWFYYSEKEGLVPTCGYGPCTKNRNDNVNSWAVRGTCPNNDPYSGCGYWALQTGKFKKKAGEWF